MKHSIFLCKFTPLGFETEMITIENIKDFSVNLPRWGLKLIIYVNIIIKHFCVNLPRWGLKPRTNAKKSARSKSVNLPRWGLKHKVGLPDGRCIECKFTPLGFETYSNLDKANCNIV